MSVTTRRRHTKGEEVLIRPFRVGYGEGENKAVAGPCKGYSAPMKVRCAGSASCCRGSRWWRAGAPRADPVEAVTHRYVPLIKRYFLLLRAGAPRAGRGGGGEVRRARWRGDGGNEVERWWW